MESILYTDAHLEKAEIHPVAGGFAGVYTIRSPDRDGDPNEDSVGIVSVREDRGVLVLADGVGGVRGGSVASALAVAKLKRDIERGVAADQELRACIVNGFESANAAILETGLGAATTLAVLDIQAERVRPYHVGDSVVMMVGQRGKLKFQTVAHSPVGYAVESGVLGEQEAMDHDERNIVSNVVGSSDMHIALGAVRKMHKHDTVILASDGLTDNLHTDEIIDIIRTGRLEQVLDTLAKKARDRMLKDSSTVPSKPDDLSFIVFRWAQ